MTKKKRQFSKKGHPETHWGEKDRLTLAVTNEGKEAAKKRAERLGISVSEVIERWGRSLPVDENLTEVVTPTEFLSFKLIMRSLAALSKKELGQLVRAGIEILIGSSTRKITKIAELVRENQDVCIAVLSGLMSEERIDAIASGSRPTDDELSYLSSPLGKSYQELEQLRYEEFGNGSAHSATGNNI